MNATLNSTHTDESTNLAIFYLCSSIAQRGTILSICVRAIKMYMVSSKSEAKQASTKLA